MNTLPAIITGAALMCGISSAGLVDYFTNFSNSDSPGFVDGSLDAQNSWIAHPALSVSDAAGSGRVNQVNANGPVHLDSSANLTSELAAGKTIKLTLAFNFDGEFSNQNDGAWLLGLCNDSGGMPEGASNTIGGAVFQNNSNSNFWLSPIAFPNGSKFDTGIAWDATSHILTTTITKSAAENEFEITTHLDGKSTSYTMTHEGLWTGADTAYAGFRFRGVQAGNIDSFSVSSGSGGGGNGNGIIVEHFSYDAESGVTIDYTSTVGPVDIYRNITGDLRNFSLIASNETGGTYVDETADATLADKAFYVLVAAGDLPSGP